MKVRFIVDKVFDDSGALKGYSLYDEYEGDYIGTLFSYEEEEDAHDVADEMNADYKVSL